MNYIIHTPSAARLKKEILDRVSEKVDAMARELLLGRWLRRMEMSECWYIPPTNGRRRDV